MYKKREKLSKDGFFEKTTKFLIYFVRVTLVLAALVAIWKFEWSVLFVSAVILFLTYLPNMIEKKFSIDIPIEFEVAAVLFIYATLFLGEVKGYYVKFWWWDIILHAGSALVFALIGFIILYVMDKTSKIRASPIIIAMFSFSFALAIGALWEIFEFGVDSIFGSNMQKSGLVDTMWDLIVDAAAALIVSALGFIYLKKEEGIIGVVVRRFKQHNPKFFKK
jgi:hypothetical protein